jgi:hypothetical protein
MGAGVMAARPGSTFQPTPPQGGKGGGAVQPTQPQTPYTPIGSQGGKGGRGPIQPQPVQPTQTLPLFNNGVNDAFTGIPGQGGKAPLTPQQVAALGANVDPVRPPQVQQPAPLGLNLGNMIYGGGGGQQPTEYPQRDLGYGNQLPQGMPRPVSIQPVRPAPAPVQTRGPVTRNMQPAATQGLAALMNRRR